MNAFFTIRLRYARSKSVLFKQAWFGRHKYGVLPLIHIVAVSRAADTDISPDYGSDGRLVFKSLANISAAPSRLKLRCPARILLAADIHCTYGCMLPTTNTHTDAFTDIEAAVDNGVLPDHE